PVRGFPSGELGFTNAHRKFANLSLLQDVRARPFDPLSDGPSFYLGNLDLQISFANRSQEAKDYIDVKEIESTFQNNFESQIFTVGQSLIFDFKGVNILATVMNVATIDIESLKRGIETNGGPRNTRGVLIKQTALNIVKDPDSNIKLKGTKSAMTSIIQPNFKFEDMGIGGLDNEFSAIFRRAFASRIFPPSIVERLGIQHVKGILLFGPPGTGKTLMARQIGKMLNAKDPIIVNGPEILNKFVGQSEENIRKLFAPAEQEYKQKGEESSLHIIIFDELDAICKQRGAKNDGTGVGDSVVNQLLSKMDGVDQLNNILIIGMTNRLDMIDEALLRPGRMEIHMEISLPDEKGRVQILKVHTSQMARNGLLGEDVDLAELAVLTKNFSGAEIAGLIKSASSFAFNRHVEVGTLAGVKQDYENMHVTRSDFMRALDEVKPAFGISDAELQQCILNGIIKYSDKVQRVLNDGRLFVEQVRNSERTPLVSVLLHGPPNSGKTALAATIAMQSDFPFIKLISPETMVGFSESAKISMINKVFTDAYKSPYSVIMIDSIERLIEYVSIGPRFSNSVLQTLLVLLKRPPPKNKRLLIIGTTSQRSILEQMEVTDAFNALLYVGDVDSLASVDFVLQELGVFGDAERRSAMKLLQDLGVNNRDRRISIGIKKLITLIEMANQDLEKVEKFANVVIEEGTVSMRV
ncbi:transport between ER and Golgi ATPase protein, partial [Nowakowskiella sp. JEL0407]